MCGFGLKLKLTTWLLIYVLRVLVSKDIFTPMLTGPTTAGSVYLRMERSCTRWEQRTNNYLSVSSSRQLERLHEWGKLSETLTLFWISHTHGPGTTQPTDCNYPLPTFSILKNIYFGIVSFSLCIYKSIWHPCVSNVKILPSGISH